GDAGQWPEAALSPLAQEDARECDPEDRLQEVEQVDLVQNVEVRGRRVGEGVTDGFGEKHGGDCLRPDRDCGESNPAAAAEAAQRREIRSEERRVGKEWRCRRWGG